MRRIAALLSRTSVGRERSERAWRTGDAAHCPVV
jgi:hypothetical protein